MRKHIRNILPPKVRKWFRRFRHFIVLPVALAVAGYHIYLAANDAFATKIDTSEMVFTEHVADCVRSDTCTVGSALTDGFSIAQVGTSAFLRHFWKNKWVGFVVLYVAFESMARVVHCVSWWRRWRQFKKRRRDDEDSPDSH